ncbi:MAG: alkaline phosphatase [Candidatus Longimicrobiales bacterium M2_2A_002]
MRRLLELTVLAAALAACSPATPDAPSPLPEPDVEPGPYSVILVIGDGTGLGYWSAARLSFPSVAIDEMPVVGLVGTTSSNSYITDSAAGATAFATGVKTYNHAIGVGPDTARLETVLEVAEGQGMATGLVVTSAITHATPAAFAAHVPDRYMYFAIASQLAASGPDVMIGGGRRFFEAAERPDSADLLAALAEEATVVDSAAALRDLDPSQVDRLVAFIAEEDPARASDRPLTLAEMTETALEILQRDEDGFFLMVEASQVDWVGEENAPLPELLAELYDLDGAVRAAMAFQERRPNTLLVVTADHDTGGLALHYDSTGVFRAHYTTVGHTAGLVPLFARGPGSDALGGTRENDEVGRILLELIRGDGPAAN